MQNQIIDKIEKEFVRPVPIKKDSAGQTPPFEVGNTVCVYYRIIEGEKERVQAFEGVVITKSLGAKNARANFTVRRVHQGFGVERIFPLHSPRVEQIVVLKQGIVRRAKLYYLRQLKGRAARIKEKLY